MMVVIDGNGKQKEGTSSDSKREGKMKDEEKKRKKKETAALTFLSLRGISAFSQGV